MKIIVFDNQGIWDGTIAINYVTLPMQLCEEAILCCMVKLQLKRSNGMVENTSWVMNEEELVS